MELLGVKKRLLFILLHRKPPSETAVLGQICCYFSLAAFWLLNHMIHHQAYLPLLCISFFFFCSCKVNQKIQAGYEGGKEKLICNYLFFSFCHCQIVNSLHSTKSFSELFSTKGQPPIISDGSLCSCRGSSPHIMLRRAYTIFSIIISLQCLQLPPRRKDHPGPFENKETILLALPSEGL